MSIPRSAIAETLEIPEGRVKCENCICTERWINGAYICKAWGKQITYADGFCSLFAEKEEADGV